MGIEYYDEERGKWILYKTQDESSQDCRDYPFEEIPCRVFLDTNVVNIIFDYPEQLFENFPIPAGIDETLAEDIEALMHIMAVGQRASWNMVVSKATIAEIDRVTDLSRRKTLRSFAFEFFDTDEGANEYASIVGRRMIDAHFAAALPDSSDRELIGNAIGLGCDVFCTRDRRTILKKRDKVVGLPIKLLSPREWWKHIKPWAGLWL